MKRNHGAAGNYLKTVLVLATAMMLCVGYCFVQADPAFAAGSGDAQEYRFDRSKTATKQLQDLFTTLDIMDATVEELTGEMEAGNATSEQITRMYIDRINAYDRKLKLNSIISVNPNAIKEAKQLDKERAAGKIRGPLHGIPILVKDNIDVAGMATSGGSLALAHMISPTDAGVVKKLKAAGAVIVAKANLSEFASSAVHSASLLGGEVHNAYDTARVPAGSSGGTGVAITSNFAAVGLGTDTGGSIRNPSSYSNLYGVRPTKGLTSIDGVIPLIAPRDTVGPMARTAEDMALVLQVIAGTDEKDDFTREADADALLGEGYMSALSTEGLKGKRIGYLTSSFEFDLAAFEAGMEDQGDDQGQGDGQGGQGGQGDGQVNVPEPVKIPSARIDAMIKRTRADLRKAGAEFVDLSSVLDDHTIDVMIELGNIDDTTEYDFNKYLHDKGDAAPYKTLKELYKSGKVGIYHTNLPVYPTTLEDMADSFETTVDPYNTEVNGYMRGETWSRALAFRKYVQDLMKENDIDAIMYVATMDVVPTYAHFSDEFSVNNMGFFRYGFTFGPALGMPEVAIPMGFSDADDQVTTELPLGMRLVGRYGDEKNLMEMAYAYEQQAGDSIRRMPANSPALEDKALAAYLEALMDEACSIDYSAYNKKPEGKIQLMKSAWAKAAAVDTSDPYATYKAAENLAKAYDKVMKSLKSTGVKKTPTSFTVKLSKKKIKAKAKKKQTVKVKVSKLTKGASKPVFSVRRVTNGQEGKIKVNKATGKVTIKKKTKKCKVVIQVSSPANTRCTGLTRSVTITVK